MRSARIALFALGALFEPVARAELQCEPQDSLQRCWQRLQVVNDDARAQVHRDTQVGEETKLKEAPTGLNAAGLVSAVKNFLPLADLSVLGSEAGRAVDEERDSGLTAATNVSTHSGLDGDRLQVAADAAERPRLGSLLEHRLEQADLGSRVKELRDSLNTLDDRAFEFSYSIALPGFGRSFDSYRGRLTSLFLEATRASNPSANAFAQALYAVQSITRKARKAGAYCRADSDMAFRDISCVNVEDGKLTQEQLDSWSANVRRDVQIAWENAARAGSDFEQRLKTAVSDSKLDRFNELVNNQPQLYVSVRRLQRNNLVGAGATSAKLTLEQGIDGLSDFESGAGKTCVDQGPIWTQGAAAAGPQCLQAYQQYVVDNSGRLRRAVRWSASIEYMRIDDLDVELPADRFSLQVPGASRWSASLNGGLFLRGEGTPWATRLDASAAYHYFSAAGALRNHYGVLAVTLTQKIGGVAIPIHLVYRTRDELEAGAGRDRVAATIGLNFNAFAPTHPASIELPTLPTVVPVK